MVFKFFLNPYIATNTGKFFYKGGRSTGRDLPVDVDFFNLPVDYPPLLHIHITNELSRKK